MKRTIALLLALVMVLALAACGSKNDTQPAAAGSAEAENAAAPAEKELRIAVTSNMTDFDATQGNGSTVLLEVARLAETLVNVDKEFQIYPGLATSWERTGDKTWVFHLRDDVTFQDGTKFNAEAVKWWLEKTRDNMASFDTYTHIESVDVVDEYTIQCNLNKSFSELPEAMTNQCCLILSPTSFKDDGTFDKPIGTGYFQFESFDVNQSILTLVPYDDYWADKPDSSITRRVIKSIPDPSTRALAASNGEVDVAIDVPFSELTALENEPGIDVLKYNTARTYLWSYNLDKPYLQDVNVRRALIYAINREEIVNDVLLGVGGVAHGVMMDEIPWTNTDVDMYDYDPAKAMALLDEAGFVDSDGDGIREYQGQEVKITLITGSYRPGLPLIAQAMQGYFTAIGLDAEAQVLEGNTMTEVRESGEWDLVSNSMAACYIPSASYYISQMFHSESSNASRLGYKNEALDKIIDDCMATDDLETKYDLSRQAQALAQEDAVTYTVCLYGAVFIMNEKLTGFDYSPAVHDFVVPITTDIAD